MPHGSGVIPTGASNTSQQQTPSSAKLESSSALADQNIQPGTSVPRPSVAAIGEKTHVAVSIPHGKLKEVLLGQSTKSGVNTVNSPKLYTAYEFLEEFLEEVAMMEPNTTVKQQKSLETSSKSSNPLPPDCSSLDKPGMTRDWTNLDKPENSGCYTVTFPEERQLYVQSIDGNKLDTILEVLEENDDIDPLFRDTLV